MLPEYASDGARDHVEEPASDMGKQYAQPERGRGSYQVESDYPPGNCHAFHSERPRDRFLAFNSSPEQ
jgi:hypothetical protein